MPRYDEFVYNDGTKYGQEQRTSFTAEPVSAVALDYTKVGVFWNTPKDSASATYSGFRVVRNQDAYPENEEDGVIVYSFYSHSSKPDAFRSDPFIDSVETTGVPVVGGRFIYYRAWILLDDTGEWVRAGDAYTLVPAQHNSFTSPNTVQSSRKVLSVDSETGKTYDMSVDETVPKQTLLTTHDRFMGFIPKVFHSATNSPLDEDDPNFGSARDSKNKVDYSGTVNNTLLGRFLSAFSFTVDEFLTFADLVLPDVSGKNSSPDILGLQTRQFGLNEDPMGVTKTQKKLVREAIYSTSHKGTMNGLNAFVESVTGYDSSISQSPNLMLSIQDSTFYKGIGYWKGSTGTSLAPITTASITRATEANAVDDRYSMQVTTTTATSTLSNGSDFPVTRGIPVTTGSTYTFSYYLRLSSQAGLTPIAVVPVIKWYDRLGRFISKNTGTSYTTTTSWVKRTYTPAAAPALATYASVEFELTNAAVMYLDALQFSESSVTTYYEARGVEIFMKPKKTNYVLNPSFEVDTSNWVLDVASSSLKNVRTGTSPNFVYDGPIGARLGAKKLEIVGKSGTSVSTITTVTDTGLTLGQFYTFSFYAKSNAAKTVTVKLGVSGSTTQIATSSVSLTTSWQRFYVTYFMPINATATGLTAVITGQLAGAVVQLDATQIEPAYSPTDYFDGDVIYGSWNGTANASRSYIYPNRDSKMLRLSKEIEEYLPINTAYHINSYIDGSEYNQYWGVA